MRTFSSYGPIDKDLHYFVPRKELLTKAYNYLIGDNPDKGGHYITVWAPRQTGKSSLLRDIYWDILRDDRYYVANIDIQSLSSINDTILCLNTIVGCINRNTKIQLPFVKTVVDF